MSRGVTITFGEMFPELYKQFSIPELMVPIVTPQASVPSTTGTLQVSEYKIAVPINIK